MNQTEPPISRTASFVRLRFLAGMLVDKFAYHLPLYRQHQRLRDAGIALSRSTLVYWTSRAIDLLAPVTAAQSAHVLASRVLAMDETSIKAGREAKGKMRTGWLWPVYGDADEVVFHYVDAQAQYGRRVPDTDLDLAMAAAGLRGVLVEAPAAGGFDLAAKTDALVVRTRSDAARGADFPHPRTVALRSTTSSAPTRSRFLAALGTANKIRSRAEIASVWRCSNRREIHYAKLSDLVDDQHVHPGELVLEVLFGVQLRPHGIT